MCLGKSYWFGLPRVPFVNCCQFMYLVISLLVLRAGCGIWLYQFLIIAYLFTFHSDRNIIFDDWNSHCWLMFPWFDFISTFFAFPWCNSQCPGQLLNLCVFQTKIKRFDMHFTKRTTRNDLLFKTYIEMSISASYSAWFNYLHIYVRLGRRGPTGAFVPNS